MAQDAVENLNETVRHATQTAQVDKYHKVVCKILRRLMPSIEHGGNRGGSPMRNVLPSGPKKCRCV